MSDVILNLVEKIKYLLKNEKRDVNITQVKVRSFSECPECGEKINNGYFKITKPPEQTVILTHDSFHDMDVHLVYTKDHGATDKVLGELLQENEGKNPRDQLNFKEIQAQIKEYSLDELNEIIDEITKN